MFNLEKKILPHSQVELKGEIPADKFMSHWSKAFSQIANKVQIPGFRAGNAPEKVVLEHVGEMTILQEAAELALQESYVEIVKAEKLDVIGRPEITITKIAKDNPLGFTITTSVYPEIKLPDYKKIASKITATPLTVEEVKDEEVEKIAKEVKEDPEKIKENLAAQKKHRAEEKRRLEIMKAITEAMKLDLPVVMVETELEKMFAEFSHDIAQMGLKVDDYLKHIKKTEADLKAEWQEQATERVKFGLTLNAIAEAEKVEVSTDKLETELNHLKTHYPNADEGKMRAYVKSILESDAVWQILEKTAEK